MKFLQVITLLTFLACASNKCEDKQKQANPTCEEFYEFYNELDKRLGLEEGSSLSFLKDGVKNNKCGICRRLTCNGIDYCVGPMR